MDEDQYRSTYQELNPNRCIFEKAITNQRCDCELKRKFVLASRECVACESKSALTTCTAVLDSMRNNARFSLKVVTINGPMPHNKELQVQAGGMLALQNLLPDSVDTTTSKHRSDADKNKPTNTPYQAKQADRTKIALNIHQIIKQALLEYQTIEKLPYSDIVKEIVIYESRPKRRKK